MFKSFFILIILLIGVLAFPQYSLGLMSTGTYTIFADSIDAGGILSVTGTFSLEDTLGESPTGSSVTSTYEIIAGYQAMDWSVLNSEVNTNDISLGTLEVGIIASSSVTFLISTNADTGYVLSVGAVAGSSLQAVSDGEVTAGQEEYGIAVEGAHRAFTDDRGIVAGLNLASWPTSVDDIVTTVIFKASISGTSLSGNRNQTVTFVLSTNL